MTSVLKSNKDLHLQRKLFHLTGVLSIFLCMNYLTEFSCWIIYAALGIPFAFWDFIRHKVPAFNKFTLKYFGPILRDYEENQLSGVTYLVIGVGLTFFFFNKSIALLAILFLAIGDPTASLFGILYGQDKIWGRKSLQGTLAAFIVCSLLAYTFFSVKGLLLDHLLVCSFIAGLSAAIAELIPIADLDDNLTQPLVSSVLLTGLFYIFGGF